MRTKPAQSAHGSRSAAWVRYTARVVGALACVIAARGADQAIDRLPVASTSIKSVGYDGARRALEVEFRSGALYRYQNVPQRVFLELARSDSKGRYFSKKIRGKFTYERIPPRLP